MAGILLSLTHLSMDEIAAISQTFSNTFLWIKKYEYRLKFHWSLFLRVQIIFQHWFRKWLGADQATSHYLNQSWPNSLKRITVWNGHAQLMFAFPDLGRARVLLFSERLVFRHCDVWKWMWLFDIISITDILISWSSRLTGLATS